MNFLSYNNYTTQFFQNVISYKIEPEFLFESSLISLKTIDT